MSCYKSALIGGKERDEEIGEVQEIHPTSATVGTPKLTITESVSPYTTCVGKTNYRGTINLYSVIHIDDNMHDHKISL